MMYRRRRSGILVAPLDKGEAMAARQRGSKRSRTLARRWADASRRRGRKDDAPQGHRRRLLKVGAWVGAALLAGVSGMLTGVVPAILGQLFDVNHSKDTLRSGPEIGTVVTVSQNVDQIWMRPGVYQPPAQLVDRMSRKNGATDPELAAMLAATGVHVGQEDFEVVLEGRRAELIRITDIRPVVVTRAAPLDGTRSTSSARASPRT